MSHLKRPHLGKTPTCRQQRRGTYHYSEEVAKPCFFATTSIWLFANLIFPAKTGGIFCCLLITLSFAFISVCGYCEILFVLSWFGTCCYIASLLQVDISFAWK
jgi:hypothetical protein